MTEVPPGISGLQALLNRSALALAVLILAGIGAFWLYDRTRPRETPAWDAGRFAAMSAPDSSARATWMVVVNPDCMHCRARLAELLRHQRDPARDPVLGVLLVDVRHRPEPLDDASRLDGGVYWDSLGVWRSHWGHRVYGEVLVFAPGGALVRVVGPDADPQATAAAAALAR
jgi:hypothetical protein